MLRQSFLVRCLLAVVAVGLGMLLMGQPVLAAVDPYVTQFLKVTEPIPLPANAQGQTRLFSGEALSQGKRLFMQHCINCHVGGTTLQSPTISLSLAALKGATPPRDNINNFVAYLREPTSYDGGDDNYWCRQVPETWLPTEAVETLAAFILRAAEKAPGWATETFE